MDDSILNEGLELAMEFGKNWLQPIQGRLGACCALPDRAWRSATGSDARSSEAPNTGGIQASGDAADDPVPPATRRLEAMRNRLLGRRHKELSRSELDGYERVCREAMQFGHEQVRVEWHAAARNEQKARRRFGEVMKERYPWISEGCVGHLFSQGCYYAWKDGDL